MAKAPKKSKPTKKPATTPKPAAKTIVMLGLDKQRKPQAARFIGESDAILAKAAAAMGLRLAVPVTRKHFEIVDKLPLGRINATGNGLVPHVDQKLYDQINALIGGEPGTISSTLPKDWASLAPGHLVIAQDTIDDGWWPAIITKRSGETVSLKWRDFPTQAGFTRPIAAVALIHTA